MKLFSKKIKELRKSLYITQNDIYESTGIHPDTLRRIEKGENIPNYETVEKLSLFYGIDLLNILNLCKNDVVLKDIYDDIDNILLNNEETMIEKVQLKILEFNLNSKISSLVKPELLDQCKYFLKLLSHYKDNEKKNNIYLGIQLKECLYLTFKEKNLLNPSRNYSHLELRILLLIALLKIEQKNYRDSNSIFFLIKKSIETSIAPNEQDKKVYIKCICNLSYNFHDLKLNQDALEIATLGINYCKKNETYYLLYLLYARRSVANFLLNNVGYKKDALNSICILDILGYKDLKIQYMKIFENEYNIRLSSLFDNL